MFISHVKRADTVYCAVYNTYTIVQPRSTSQNIQHNYLVPVAGQFPNSIHMCAIQ